MSKKANILPNFGFSTVNIGSITVYTCKIRIDLSNVPYEPFSFINRRELRSGLSLLSFETTDYNLAQEAYRYIGMICKFAAQQKLNKKYAWLQ